MRIVVLSALLVACGGAAAPVAPASTTPPVPASPAPSALGNVSPPAVVADAEPATPDGMQVLVSVPNIDREMKRLGQSVVAPVAGFMAPSIDGLLSRIDTVQRVDRGQPMVGLLIGVDGTERTLVAFHSLGPGNHGQTVAENENDLPEIDCRPADERTMVCDVNHRGAATPAELEYLAYQVRHAPNQSGVSGIVPVRVLASKVRSEGDDKGFQRKFFAELATDAKELRFNVSLDRDLNATLRAQFTSQKGAFAKAITSRSNDAAAIGALSRFPGDTLAGFVSHGGLHDDYGPFRRDVLAAVLSDSLGDRLAASWLGKLLLQGDSYVMGVSLDRASLAKATTKSRKFEDTITHHGALMVALADDKHAMFDSLKGIAALIKAESKTSELQFGKPGPFGKTEQVHVFHSKDGYHVYATHVDGLTYLTLAEVDSYAAARMKALLTPGTDVLGARVASVLTQVESKRSVGFGFAKEIASIASSGSLQLSCDAPIVLVDDVETSKGGKDVVWTMTVPEPHLADLIKGGLSGFRGGPARPPVKKKP
jgi:hypothetical protein